MTDLNKFESFKSYGDNRKDLRNVILNVLFEASYDVDTKAYKNWVKKNRLPEEAEIKAVCDKLCEIAKRVAKRAFSGKEELYERFCKECEEITERFQNLNATNPTEAYCGVAQVGGYLHDEVYDLTAEALNIPIYRKEEWDY